jgi:hypothetical protein
MGEGNTTLYVKIKYKLSKLFGIFFYLLLYFLYIPSTQYQSNIKCDQMGQVIIHVYGVITHITKIVLFGGRINATTTLKK